MPDNYNDAVLACIDASASNLRAVVPGKVSAVTRAEDRERDVDFDPGIGRSDAAGVRADGTVPEAAVLYPGGGGFAMLWPLDSGDEALGLVADRNVTRWRQDRVPGQAHTLTRAHALSDTLVIPFAITAPASAPADVGADWVLVGPEGEAMRVGGADGAVTLTKGGASVATISMDADGKVSITAAPGQAVEVGGVSSLALYDQLVAAVDAMLIAGTPIVGDGGAGLLTTMTTAWEGLKSTIATKVTKGA